MSIAPQPEPLDGKDAWIALGVVAAAVAFQWPIFDRWLALQDEGYILAIADDINRGRVLYRDVTSDAPFPAAYYLLAWWFRWTGPSVESSRLLAVGGFALYVAALWRIAREFLSRSWGLGLVVALLSYRIWAFPHWQIYSYSLVSAVAITIAAALTFSYRRTRSTPLLVVAGLFAALSILSKQSYGLAVTGSLGLALLIFPWLEAKQRPTLRQALAPGAILGLATLLLLAPSLLYFVSQGAFAAMIDQTFVFPFTLMRERSFTVLPNLWPLFGQDAALRADIGSYFPAILATLWWYPCSDCLVSDMSRGPLYQTTAFWDVSLKLVYWAPIFAFAIAAGWWGTRILRARQRGEAPGDSERHLLLLAFAGGFLLSFNKPRDWVHLMMIYPPALLVGAVMTYEFMGRMTRPLRGLALTGISLALGGILLVSLALMYDLRRQVDWPLEMPRGGVFADRQNGPIIEEVVDYLDQADSKPRPIPVYPVQPMLGFLAGRETAGGYHVVWPSQNPDRDRTIIADLEKRQAQSVIYSISQFQHLGSFRENAPELFSHLVRNFEIDRVFANELHGPTLVGLRRRPGYEARTKLSVEEMVEGKRLPWLEWPFGRILSAPVGNELRLKARVPPRRTSLFFDYGVNPDRWLDVKGGPFQFQITAKTASDATPTVVFTDTIDPARNLEDRRWHFGRADLSTFAHEPVVLTWSVSSQRSEPRPAELVGWREPFFAALRRPRGPGLRSNPSR